jgi:hypothetical protein
MAASIAAGDRAALARAITLCNGLDLWYIDFYFSGKFETRS